MFRNGIPAVVLLLAAWAPAAAEGEFSKDIRPLFQRYCLSCHSTSQKIGELDLERFSDAAAARRDLQVWTRVIDMVESDQMPPRRRFSPAPPSACGSSSGLGTCWSPRRDPERETPAGWCCAA